MSDTKATRRAFLRTLAGGGGAVAAGLPEAERRSAALEGGTE